MNPVLDKFVKDNEGRVTPETISLMKPLFTQAFDNAKTASIRRSQLEKIAGAPIKSSLLDTYGIPYKTTPVKTYSPEDFAR
jgi:hypothetical protein